LRRSIELFAGERGVDTAWSRVVLVTQLSILGYVFNPVSFFYCYGDDGALRHIIPEVNNTYGHTHRYLLGDHNRVATRRMPSFRTAKAMYVSPFIGDDCVYEWRFPGEGGPLGPALDIQMALYDDDDRRFFTARLTGNRRPFDTKTLLYAFARWPTLPAQIIGRIHLHAARLRARGLEYRRPSHDGTRSVLSL
jgi:DUF1365 family protein